MTAAIAEDIRALIISEYVEGAVQKDLAEKYNVGAATVHRIIKAAGAERGRKFTARIIAEAVQDYLDSGDSIRAVAARHPLSEDTLRLELKSQELTRPNGATIPSSTKGAAIDDFINGMSIASVSDKHGVARSTIAAWLAQEGVGMQDRFDESPGVYDGGWVVVGGIKRPLKPARKKAA